MESKKNKPMYWMNYSCDINGEYHPIQGSYYSHYRSDYPYTININKIGYKWRYTIFIDMLSEGHEDILVWKNDLNTMKDCKKEIEQLLNMPHDFSDLISSWKRVHVCPCFDEDLNLIGDWYTTYPILDNPDYQNNKDRWQWYNDKYVHNPKYVLNKTGLGIKYEEYTWTGRNSYISTTETVLVDKMIDKLKDQFHNLPYKYIRFSS